MLPETGEQFTYNEGLVMRFLKSRQIHSAGVETSPEHHAHKLDSAASEISTKAGTFILRRARYFNETKLYEKEPVVSGAGAANTGSEKSGSSCEEIPDS